MRLRLGLMEWDYYPKLYKYLISKQHMDNQRKFYEILTAPTADKLVESINAFLADQQGNVQKVFSDGDAHFAHIEYISNPILVPSNLPLREARALFEMKYITQTLEHNKGDILESARKLGMGKESLKEKIAKYQIEI